jgi:hypothetical protein
VPDIKGGGFKLAKHRPCVVADSGMEMLGLQLDSEGYLLEPRIQLDRLGLRDKPPAQLARCPEKVGPEF